MVRPIEREKNPNHMLEDRLAQKFDDLQIAREEGAAGLFDEIAKSIEVLLRAVPTAYNELQQQKQELDQEIEQVLYQIQLDARSAQDKIYRDAIINRKTDQAEWEYREVYEEIIIDILQKHGLISILRNSRSQLSNMEQQQHQTKMQAPQQEEQEEPEPEPEQEQQNKPHLISKKAKKGKKGKFKI